MTRLLETLDLRELALSDYLLDRCGAEAYFRLSRTEQDYLDAWLDRIQATCGLDERESFLLAVKVAILLVLAEDRRQAVQTLQEVFCHERV